MPKYNYNINDYSSITSLTNADKLLAWSNDNGDTRKVSLAALMAFVESQFASPDFTTVITAPTSSGFNIQMPAYTTSVWEIINPTGTFAAGTLTLPAPADCFDGQQVVVCTTQIITAFTLAGNGATTVGVPTSLGAGGFFAVRFNALQSTWYCTSQNVVSTFTTLTLTSGINDSNGNELLKVVATGAAVNEVTLTNAATGNAPSLSATGSDPNIALNLVSKGTEPVKANGVPVLYSAAAGVQTFLTTPSSANLLAAVTGETGTNKLVFSDGPTLVQPVIDTPLVSATTFALLPGPFVPLGARSMITDCNATLAAGIGTAAAGGGANVVPVFYDGANWIIGG